MIKFFKDKNKVDEQIEFAKLDVAEETTVAYDPNLGFQIRQRTKLDEMTDKIEKALSACDGIRDSLKAECVADRVLGDVLIAQKTHDTAKRYTNRMAARLRNYTCADPNMQTSKPKNVHNMFVNGKNYEVNDMFENDHAKIFTIDNFLTQNECDILMKHGKGRLQRATVAAEDGTSILSNHRRANQATYETHRVASDPLHALYSRILTTANTKSGLNMGPEGQEGFTIIQYDPTDEYT